MTSGGNNVNDFRENQLIEFRTHSIEANKSGPRVLLFKATFSLL